MKRIHKYTCQICGTTVYSNTTLDECQACGANAMTKLTEIDQHTVDIVLKIASIAGNALGIIIALGIVAFAAYGMYLLVSAFVA